MSDYRKNGSSRRTGHTSSAQYNRSQRSGSSSGTRSGRSTASSRGSSGRRSSSASGSSARRSSSRHGRRRRRSSPDFARILLGVAGVFVLVLCISLAVRGCGEKEEAVSTESTEAVETVQASQAVTVDGIDISGMTQEEAKEALLKQYNWSMKVTYQDKEIAVGNLMEAKVTELLDELYAGELKAGESYEVSTDNMTEPAMAEAALIAGNWNMVPKNGGISGYDKESGTFTFTEGANGLVIDQEGLAAAIVAAIEEKAYDRVIPASVKEVSPELTAEQLKEKYKTIATYTTKTTSNSNRNENIRLACAELNGTIVNPGQEFSFNDTTGARTEAKGYKPATAYLNGEVVQEPGGGVCQVSSTLYNAVIFAGLKSTERHAHSYEPSYVTPGEDAAVSYGGPDFRFVNNSDYPIAIKTSFANQELTISIYGVQILPDGTKIRMESEKTSDIEPPAPTYEEDQTLQLDEEKVEKEAILGSRWTTHLVRYEDGTEVSREHFHNSTYRGKAAVIKRNTSGVVITTVDPSAETGETLESETIPEDELGPGQSPGTEGLAGEGPEFPEEPSEESLPAVPDAVKPGTVETISPEAAPGQQNQELVIPAGPGGSAIP